MFFQVPMHFPQQLTKFQAKLLVLLVSGRIFRMSQSWQPGWKVLNCLTNTTKILRRKIKHGKLGFLFQGLAFRPLD